YWNIWFPRPPISDTVITAEPARTSGPSKLRDRGPDPGVQSSRRLPTELGSKQIGRSDQPRLVILAHAERAETEQSGIRTHRSCNSLCKFAHRVALARGDVPGRDPALLAGVRIGTQHRLDHIIDMDEVEHLRA